MRSNTLSNQEKLIYGHYALIGAGAIMMIIPVSLLPYAGLSCVFVGLISAYIHRLRHKQSDVTVFHMIYLIKTCWISTLILTVGIILFGSIIFFNGDLGVIDQMITQAQSGVIPTDADMIAMQLEFVEANRDLILIAAIICLLPYPAYILYRTIKGARMVSDKKEG